MVLIDKCTHGLSIERQCELLGLPRSTYYYQAVEETEENLFLMRKMDELHLNHPYYGVLRMQAELSTEESPINEKRIRRLMRKMGIEALYPRPNTSKPCPWNKRFPYLLRDIEINCCNQVWSTDITYIPMKNGFMYLCAIIDWHSKYLLSWQLSNSMDVSFCIDCLEDAMHNYGNPKIINTDQGSQFTSEAFIEKVLENGTRLSMDGKGRATDNVCIERFWRSIKYEKLYLCGYDNTIDLFLGITEYVNFYNNQRKHQSLGYQTPKTVYAEVLQAC